MTVKRIGVEEFKERLEKGDKFVLVDCREPIEWETGKISGAIPVALSTIDEDMKKIIENKEDEIIIYCLISRRSESAATFLQEHDFTNVCVMEGGVRAWQKIGGKLVNE